jgi:HEPN domain-containing protein
MRSTESGFNQEVYREAAKENLTVAQELLGNGHYVSAAYLAGVAVECLFRAYAIKNEREFDTQHSLFPLAASSGYLDNISVKEKTRLTGELHQVASRWRNNHRYRSEKAYREFVAKERLYVIVGNQTTREDNVVFSTRILVNSASRLIESGELRWQQ